MSQPLELTIYPPLAKQPLPFDPDWQGWGAWREWKRLYDQEFQQRRDARLTDAELSAEYWAQVHDSQYAMTCELAAEDKPGRKAARHWGAQSDRKAQTLHRFATSPHYFEADQ